MSGFLRKSAPATVSKGRCTSGACRGARRRSRPRRQVGEAAGRADVGAGADLDPEEAARRPVGIGLAQRGDPLRRLARPSPAGRAARLSRAGPAGRRRAAGCRTASRRASRRSRSGRRGSPHSSHSLTVSGMLGSSIVVTTSTNGHLGDDGPPAVGSLARTRRPGAARPRTGRASRSGCRRRGRRDEPSATATWSSKVCCLCSSLAVEPPPAAALATAADVGVHEDDAPVEQRRQGRRPTPGSSTAS